MRINQKSQKEYGEEVNRSLEDLYNIALNCLDRRDKKIATMAAFLVSYLTPTRVEQIVKESLNRLRKNQAPCTTSLNSGRLKSK